MSPLLSQMRVLSVFKHTVSLIFFALLAFNAHADQKIALIVANSDYSTPGWDLENPKNDAALMRGALEEVGFEVHTVLDATRNDMERAFQSHGERLKAAGPSATGFFYFAGHGVQSEGLNYLIPSDAEAYTEADVWAQAPRLENLFRHLNRAGNERNFVVLDACRNNPLLSSTRDISGGLATVKEAHGTLIAYATSPGAVAEDGTQNSPYSTVLAELMTEPGQSVETLFRRVRTRVERITDNRQRPWTESGLSGDADYCFAGCDPRQAPASDEASAALKALNSGSLTELQAFMSLFPNSRSRGLVEREISLLSERAPSETSSRRDLSSSVPAPQSNERWEQYAGLVVPGCDASDAEEQGVCQINRLEWSPNGAMIAAASSDGYVRVFDNVTGQEISSWPSGYDISATAIAWNPESNKIALSSIWDDHVRIFDAKRAYEVGSVKLQGAGPLSWDLKSRQLLVAHRDGISAIEIGADGLSATQLISSVHGIEDVRDIAIEKDLVLIAGETNQAPRASLMQIGQTDGVLELLFPPASKTGFASRHVSSIDIAPNRKQAVIGTFNGWAYIFDLSTGEIIETLIQGETDANNTASPINALDWSPDGQRVLATDEDPRVRLYNAQTGELMSTLETNRFNADAAAFNPTGDRLAVASIDGTLRLWRLMTR